MAEEAKKEKKPSRAERMYGKGNKISDAQSQEKPAAKEAEKTAGEPEQKADSPKETAAMPTESGAIPMHEVHGREMREMSMRHQREYKDMIRRHSKERGLDSGDKGETEEVGKSGTEPK